MARKHTDWRLVILLWVAGLGTAAQFGKMSVSFDRLAEVYPEAGAVLGFAVSLVGFLGVVLGVVAGVLVTRLGMRRALLAGLVLGAALSAWQATFPPLWLFLATRLVEGATHLAIIVAAPTLIAEVTAPRDRGLTLTFWGTFFAVAFALLAWIGLPLVEAHGPGGLLWAHAAYMLGIALVLWPILPRDTQPEVAAIPGFFEAHRRIYSSARIGAPAIGWLFYAMSFVSLLTVLPLLLPPSERAFVTGAIPLMSIAVSMTMGVWLLRRIEAVKVITLGFAVASLLALALTAMPGNVAVLLALGASLGLVQGASFAAVAQLNETEADRALANGGLAQTGNLGNTIGTPLLLATLSAFGETGMTLALTLFFAIGGGAHLFLGMQRRRTMAAQA